VAVAAISPAGVEVVDYAPYGRRVKAALIDGVLLAIVLIIVTGALLIFANRGGAAQGFFLTLAYVIAYFGPTVYYVLCVAQGGQTIGKMMSDIAVRRDGDEEESIGYVRSLIRAVVPGFLWLLIIPGLLDVLWPLWDPKRQTLHDKIAGSVVVEA
jgi:uncharacterized RDD family membrane protein YckC